MVMQAYDPAKHHRRSIRLKEYDYSSSGYYFITICCQNHECFFSQVGAPQVVAQSHPYPNQSPHIPTPDLSPNDILTQTFQTSLNDAGKMIQAEWEALPDRFSNIELHAYIVMPNHFHAIMEIRPENTETTAVDKHESEVQSQRTYTLGEILAAFKSLTTVKYIEGVKTSSWKRFDGKLWQRNYYEHIIRTSAAFDNITNYIINNPAKWVEDRFYR